MNTIIGNAKTGVYIIDANYRIVYFNKVLQHALPTVQIGDVCYRDFCAENAPCKECPLAGAPNDSTIFYNKKLGKWLEVSTGTIEWPDSGLCNVILSRTIHKGHRNLFYNLACISVYDELFELNPAEDSCKTIYTQVKKYVSPTIKAPLSAIIREAAKEIVHPNDKDAFLEFWNLSTLLKRLAASQYLLKARFRKKKTDGSYCWVLQTLVPLLKNSNNTQIIMCFVQDIQDEQSKKEQLQIQNLSDHSDFDPITGLYKKGAFFRTAQKFLEHNGGGRYCLMALDIEHFKLFNEWYGQEAGDQFLIHIAGYLKKAQSEYGGLAGYIGDDDFCMILPNQAKILTFLQAQIMNYVKRYGQNAGFLPAIGMYAIEDYSIPVNTMYDRACIALNSVKGNYGKRLCWYHSDMIHEMEENLLLLSEIQRALKYGEFIFYVQPKCNMATGKIIGLESLVRWQHPVHGLIPPGKFIPLLEHNGFIVDLDQYVWESVCRTVREWLNKGYRPIPVSVNVSRVDIHALDVVMCFKKLTQKYHLEPRLIEIEITESAYAEESKIITGVLEELRAAGFTVLMDDFGSGYSSLNMLKDVNVDVLKIDMKFLEMNEKSAGKVVGILEAITSMARLMDLRMIAEGVETKEQINFLLDIGCLYGQGYYFYHPMPLEKFEPLLDEPSNIDFRGIKAKKMARIYTKELLNENLFSESMIHNILGGIAFYDVYHGKIKLLRVNEQYYKITGTNPVDLQEQSHEILHDIYEADQPIMLDLFRQAALNPLHGAEGTIRHFKKDGTTIWIHLHIYFLREQNGHKLHYGSVNDITESMMLQKQLAERNAMLLQKDQDTAKIDTLNNELHILMKYMPESIFLLTHKKNNLHYKVIANGICRMINYHSSEECERMLNSKQYENMIHPDDWKRLKENMRKAILNTQNYQDIFQLILPEGKILWINLDAQYIKKDSDGITYLCIYSDITSIKQKEQKLCLVGKKMERILYQAKINSWDWDIQNRTLTMANVIQHKKLAEICENFQNRRSIIKNFPESVLHFPNIPFKYRKQFAQFLNQVRTGFDHESFHCEIPFIVHDNKFIWIKIACETLCNETGKPVKAVGYYIDITSQKNELLQNKKQIKALELLRGQAIYDFKVSLTENTITTEKDSEIWIQETGCIENRIYTDVLDYIRVNLVLSKFRKIFQNFTNRERLLSLYEKGIYMESLDYRRIYQGKPQWMRMIVHLAQFEDMPDIFAYIFIIDIDVQKKQELLLTRRAETDSLTGLYNRQTAIPKIKNYLMGLKNESAALVMFDLDNFKLANDVFGHAYGDTMITQTAARLKSYFRDYDIICRIGGDEFLILCKNIRESDMNRKLDRMIKAMVISRPNGDQKILFSVSAGYAMIPEQGQDFDDLYQKADIALFNAKMNGKSSFTKYEPSMKAVRYELAKRNPKSIKK